MQWELGSDKSKDFEQNWVSHKPIFDWKINLFKRTIKKYDNFSLGT